VPGRLRLLAHDRELLPDDAIEERRLPRVGLSDDGDDLGARHGGVIESRGMRTRTGPYAQAYGPVLMRCRRRPTLPRPLGRSTIGAVGLNDRVRDGNGCGPYALVASEFGWFGCQIVPGARRVTVARRDTHRSVRRRANRSAGSGPIISCELTSDDGRSWMKNPTTMCDFCLQSLHIGSSQATRAIRTAALGACCHASTGGLSTGWSLPALQEG